MGIQGLLPLLKECQRGAHIQEYKGQTLGIDAYVWLHRGAYGCAEEIATGQNTVKYIKYALHKIRLLRHHGVTPYVVFDGGFLPSKKGTETDRESRRQEALSKARDLVLEGKHSQAREYYVKAVDVTPQMAYQLIKALIAENVAYVVAPYEADAQLAYLEKKGLIDGIITEDTDLLVFGCKKILFKLDSEGRCMEIKRDNFGLCREFCFSGWTDKEFRQMAILSGCDYLESIPGLGLKTAHRLMRRYKTAEKVIQFIRLEGQLKVSRDYEDQFKRAELTFLHQRVFCPTSKKLVYLEDLPESVSARLSSPQAEELRFIGPFLEDDIACAIARGDLCPLSQAKMVDIAPDSEQLKAYYKPSTNVAKGTIKDFFGPSTASCKVVTKPKKRGALGEISGNNLFSNKITEPPEHPKPATKAVKSRFFAPFDKSVPRKRDIVTIADSGDEEPRGPQQALDRQTTGSGDERSDLITAEIASKEPPADIDPDAPIAVSQTLVYTPSRDDVGESVAPGALPTIHTGERPKVTSDVILPPMPKPDPPVAPQHEEVPCGLWDPDTVSSPSCPGDSPRLRKLRRYVSPPVPSHRRRGSNREMDNVIEDCELLTSPVTDGSPAVIPRPAPIESAVQSASPGGLTDLTDLSSPRFNVRAGEHLESHRKGDRHCGDGTHESEDSLWSDEAVTPNTSFQSGGITDATPRTSKRRRDSASRLHRSNAVVIITDAKAYPEDKPSVEDRAADFDKRVTSVIAGWRQKFAPTSSRKIRKKPASPLVSSQNREAQRLLSPIRSRKQISYSDGLISSPDIVHSPPVFNAKAAEDTGYRNAALRTNDKTDKSRRSLSESTARALEAFRFKPV